MESLLVLFALLLLVAGWLWRKRRAVTTDAAGGLPEPTERIVIARSSRVTQKHECGHIGPASYVINVYGQSSSEIKDGKRCPVCFIDWIEPLVIRCASCRLPIFPGDPVAAYMATENLHLDIAYRTEHSVLGCLRWDCCPTGAAFAGHWTGQAFAPAFPGGHSAAAEALQSGRAVSGSLGSPEETRMRIHPPEESS